MDKSTIKKSEAPLKGRKGHTRQLKWMIAKVFPWFKKKKNLFATCSQVKNTLEEVGVSSSKSTIKRHFHKWKHAGFKTRCKPLVSTQTLDDQIWFYQKTSKIFGQTKTQLLLSCFYTQISLHQLHIYVVSCCSRCVRRHLNKHLRPFTQMSVFDALTGGAMLTREVSLNRVMLFLTRS